MKELLSNMPFSEAELGIHILVLLVNISLLIFSKPIVSLFKVKSESDFQLSIFRTLNVLFLFFHLLDFALIVLNKDYQNVFARLAWMLVTIYIGFFLFSFFSYLSRKKFGIEKKFDDNISYIDTYNSRLVDLIVLAFISIISLYILLTPNKL